MNATTVFEQLQTFLADMLDTAPETITPSSHLWDDLEIDSLSVLELAVFAEDNFDVDLELVLRDVNREDSDERTGATVGWLTERILASGSDVSVA